MAAGIDRPPAGGPEPAKARPGRGVGRRRRSRGRRHRGCACRRWPARPFAAGRAHRRSRHQNGGTGDASPAQPRGGARRGGSRPRDGTACRCSRWPATGSAPRPLPSWRAPSATERSPNSPAATSPDTGPRPRPTWPAGWGCRSATPAPASVRSRPTSSRSAAALVDLAVRERTPSRLPARLLPAFDPYLLGWKDRAFAVPARYAGRVHPGGGILRAVATVDGLAVGTWRIRRRGDRVTVEIEPFAALAPGAARALEQRRRTSSASSRPSRAGESGGGATYDAKWVRKRPTPSAAHNRTPTQPRQRRTRRAPAERLGLTARAAAAPSAHPPFARPPAPAAPSRRVPGRRRARRSRGAGRRPAPARPSPTRAARRTP